MIKNYGWCHSLIFERNEEEGSEEEQEEGELWHMYSVYDCAFEQVWDLLEFL